MQKHLVKEEVEIHDKTTFVSWKDCLWLNMVGGPAGDANNLGAYVYTK